MLVPEELFAEFIAGDHDGARRGNLEHARHQTRIETRKAWMDAVNVASKYWVTKSRVQQGY